MGRVKTSVSRGSFLRKSLLVEEASGGDTFVFWGIYKRQDIAASTGDITYFVESGDRMDSLAYKYYGNPRLWWVIAEANGMEDPESELYVGRKLRIPNQKYVLENVVR